MLVSTLLRTWVNIFIGFVGLFCVTDVYLTCVPQTYFQSTLSPVWIASNYRYTAILLYSSAKDIRHSHSRFPPHHHQLFLKTILSYSSRNSSNVLTKIYKPPAACSRCCSSSWYSDGRSAPIFTSHITDRPTIVEDISAVPRLVVPGMYFAVISDTPDS